MQKDNILQDRFANFGAIPSEGVWAGIEKQLDKKKRRPLFWWWLFGASATACFVVYGLTTSIDPIASVIKKTETPMLATSSIANREKTNSNIVNSETSELPLSKSEKTSLLAQQQLFSAKNSNINLTNGRNKDENFNPLIAFIEEEKTINDETNEVDFSINNSEEEVLIVEKLIPINSILKLKSINLKNPEDSLDIEKLKEINIPEELISKWRFGLSFGMWTERIKTVDWSSPTNQLADTSFNPVETFSITNNSNYKNYIPFHLSLQAEYAIHKRVNVRFGLAYSRFALRIGNGTVAGIDNSIQPASSQFFRTHTFDIPLEANYNFISKQKIQVYAGLGWTSSFYMPYKQSSNPFDYLGRVNGSVGTRILFSEKLALNIQPSFYYGAIDTRFNFYKRSLMFGGSVGLFFTPSLEKKQKSLRK